MPSDLKSEMRIPLSGVVYHEGKHWFAHCLELDLVAEGNDPDSALADLKDLIALQLETAIEEGDMASIFRPAPAEIWQLFWKGKERPVSFDPPPPVNRFDVRELAFR